MKHLIPLALALLLVGVGCAFDREPGGSVMIPEPVELSVGVTGLILSVDEDRLATLQLPDGSNELAQSNGFPMLVAADAGKVVTVTGTQDPATRVVSIDDLTFVPGNLIVTQPKADAVVTSPLVVGGFGRVFEQTFNWRIRNASGEVVEEGIAMTRAPDAGQFGPFTFEVFLPAMDDQSFTLEVLDYSARDGAEQDLVSVPLRLLSTKTSTFKVYFGKPSEGSLSDCSLVFPVERTVAETAAIGRAAIAELLKGPTGEESDAGFTTSIPAAASLRSLVIGDHVARADFSSSLEPGGGSCRVSAIRAQIENTLLQFPSVDEAAISVDGEEAEALQP